MALSHAGWRDAAVQVFHVAHGRFQERRNLFPPGADAVVLARLLRQASSRQLLLQLHLDGRAGGNRNSALA